MSTILCKKQEFPFVLKVGIGISFFLILSFSCTKKITRLEIAFQAAGKNRPELEKVIDFYSKEKKDSLKLKAALFLIENMPGHSSYKSDEILSYYKEIDPVLLSNFDAHQKREDIEKIALKYPGLLRNTVADIEIVTSLFLIKNIEQAFDDWQKPWATHLTFDEFCEYLLPYKCTELQQMDNWRDTLSAKFSKDLTNMPENNETYFSTFHTAQLVNQEIRRSVHPFPQSVFEGYTGYEFINASSLYKMPYGTCDDYSVLGVSVLRSLGIPSAINVCPLWSWQDTGHCFYSILNNDGNIYISPYDISTGFEGTFFHANDLYKIYRLTYAADPFLLEYHQKASYIHPGIDVFRKDVTDVHKKTSDVTVPLFNYPRKDNYAYVAAFNSREWKVIDVVEVNKKNALCKKLGRNLLYILFAYDGKKLTAVSHPFTIARNGEVDYVIPDPVNKEEIKVRRKYPLNLHVATMHKRMIGGQIQASNSPDFNPAVTLYTITDLEYPDLITLPDLGSFRYWRYYPPWAACGNIAELHFFEKDNEEMKRGEIMGVPGFEGGGPEKAFDNDWLTNYDSPDLEPWVGMDFGDTIRIHKVRCVPRSDDNNIRPGDEYELKCWNKNRWESLDKQVANDNYLLFNNVPQDALLWLSNLTRGKQERIFTYKEGKQVWW